MVAPTDPMRTDLQNHQLSLPLAREAENGHFHYLALCPLDTAQPSWQERCYAYLLTC